MARMAYGRVCPDKYIDKALFYLYLTRPRRQPTNVLKVMRKQKNPLSLGKLKKRKPSIRSVHLHGHNLGSRERSGSVVECLTQDRRAMGSSLTGVTALWSLSKTHLS